MTILKSWSQKIMKKWVEINLLTIGDNQKTTEEHVFHVVGKVETRKDYNWTAYDHLTLWSIDLELQYTSSP